MWIEPKTDWTPDDDYNFDDMNRVEANTKHVADYLASLSYKIPDLVVITDRDMTSIDFISSINRVERNIKVLKDNFISPPGYQEGKTWTNKIGFTFQDANRLERNLLLLLVWAQRTEQFFVYCGEFFCGEEVI